MDASGGPPQTLCDVPLLWRGGAWSREGVIIFGAARQGLMRVSDTGGATSPLTELDSARLERYHGWPAFLPDGRHFIYFRAASGQNNGIYLGSLDARPRQQSLRRLVASFGSAVYAPPPDPGAWNSIIGHLLFVREGSLTAQAFDARRLELSGEAVPIAEDVSYTGAPMLSVSTTGVLAYRTGVPSGSNSPITQLTWFDRTGKTLGTVDEPGRYNTVALSPDGTRVAFSRIRRGAREAGELGGNLANLGLGNFELWVHEFARNTSTQLTFGSGVDWMAVWSPDGSRIVFASDRDGNFNLYQKVSSGAGDEDTVLKTTKTKMPYDWSRDGHFLLYSSPVTPGQKSDLWYLPLTGNDRRPVLYLQTDASVSKARFSPDGRFVAYTSDASGMNEVYVQPFPMASGGKWKIGSGYQPYWRRDGKELFYISTDAKLMAVDVTTDPEFTVKTPKALFPTPIWGPPMFVTRYDVTGNGKKFLINALRPAGTGTPSSPITVVLNWQAGLKK